MKRPTHEEIIEHYKTGIDKNCLICERQLVGRWTDYNGQIKCSHCGMTYQILGSHLKDEFLAENGLTEKDISQRHCDIFYLAPLYKAYWDQTHNHIPEGLFIGRDRNPMNPEDFLRFYKWMVDNEETIKPLYGDFFDFDGAKADEKVMRATYA